MELHTEGSFVNFRVTEKQKTEYKLIIGNCPILIAFIEEFIWDYCADQGIITLHTLFS